MPVFAQVRFLELVRFDSSRSEFKSKGSSRASQPFRQLLNTSGRLHKDENARVCTAKIYKNSQFRAHLATLKGRQLRRLEALAGL